MKRSISVALAAALLMSGCAQKISDQNVRALSVTTGAFLGAIIGGKSGSRYGALIGAATGALLGKVIGDEIVRRRHAVEKLAKEQKADLRWQALKQKDLLGEERVKELEKQLQKSKIKIDKQQLQKSLDRPVGDSVTVSVKEQFKVGSAQLTPKAKILFQKLAQLYKKGDRKILIIGHTDDSGSTFYNQKLSEERAKTVGKIFEAAGIDKKRIYYLGAGDSMPIADNHTAQGRMKNRRVEIVELQAEKEIYLYVQSRKPNPKYFRTKAERLAGVKRRSAPKRGVLKKSVHQTSKRVRIVRHEDRKPIRSVQPRRATRSFDTRLKELGIVLTGAKPVRSNVMVLKSEFGNFKPKKRLFYPLRLEASSDLEAVTAVNKSCLFDTIHARGAIKSLGEQKSLPTSKYRPGLYETVWYGELGGYLFSLSPVAVSEDGEAPLYPKLRVYKKGKQWQKLYERQTVVNVYEGTKGLLYRVFVVGEDEPFSCVDVVFSSPTSAKAALYAKSVDGSDVVKTISLKRHKQ